MRQEMKKAFIICTSFYDFNKNEITLGGMQTYFFNLAGILKELDYRVFITSISKKDTQIPLDECTVLGFSLHTKHLADELAHRVKAYITSSDDLVIYGTDTMISIKVHFNNSIAIQHGIFWDIPFYSKKARPLMRMLLPRVIKTYKTIKRLNAVQRVVCVDYNFVNWYRTQVDYTKKNITVIPNFSNVPDFVKKDEESINIIFARRLCWYRGTKVFAAVAKRIASEYSNINITIAGEGPDESYLKETLAMYSNINFIMYNSAQSLRIHSLQDIAVVPTIGSEGTSLSLLEAMASHCAVVCTDVGGMTNIVLNEFNGLMVKAGDEESLLYAIKRLIDDKELRKQLADNAVKTVQHSFSFEIWKRQWKTVLQEQSQ